MRKPDEMEMSVNFRAMRVSWVFSGAFLAVWISVEMALHGELLFIPFILLCLQTIAFYIVKLILTKRMVRANDDDE